MSAYLLLPTEENCLVSYIHINFIPEELGTVLMRFFNTTSKSKSLFGSKLQRIHHIENNKIITMTTQEIINSGFGVSLYSQIDTRDLSEILESLSYGSDEVKFTYVFQDEEWICYAIYRNNNKRIMEEIHLYNDYFKNIIKQRRTETSSIEEAKKLLDILKKESLLKEIEKVELKMQENELELKKLKKVYYELY